VFQIARTWNALVLITGIGLRYTLSDDDRETLKDFEGVCFLTTTNDNVARSWSERFLRVASRELEEQDRICIFKQKLQHYGEENGSCSDLELGAVAKYTLNGHQACVHDRSCTLKV